MISSTYLKHLTSLKQKKYREEYKEFLIEGYHLVNECLKSNYEIKQIILRSELNSGELCDIKERAEIKEIPILISDKKVFDKFSDTKTPQGIAAVVEQPTTSKLELQKNNDNIIVLDKISDPGNMGTIIRTCHWFGVINIIAGSDCVDVYNPKVVRSSQGAIFHVDILTNTVLKIKLEELKQNNYNIYITDLSSVNTLDKIQFSKKNAIVFGSESSGVNPELKNIHHFPFRIRPYSDCESLNVAVSAGIVLYRLHS